MRRPARIGFAVLLLGAGGASLYTAFEPASVPQPVQHPWDAIPFEDPNLPSLPDPTATAPG